VRGEAPVELTIRSTRHGPVLSDVLPAGAADPGYVLALAATFTIPEDRSAEALWELNRATDWPSFREASRHFVGPIQNIVYADVDGTIGFMAPGLVPIRRNGQGCLPSPGWTGDYDWTGFIPFEALPSAVNPPSGHFVTANNKIVPDSYPYFLGRGWDLPNRAARVTALLAIRRRLAAIPTDPIVSDKREQLDRIIQACLGLEVDTVVDRAEIVPGEPGTLRHTAVVRPPIPVRWTPVVCSARWSPQLGCPGWAGPGKRSP